MLTHAEAALDQSALLVIDVQESFKLDRARWERRNNRRFESNVASLIEAYRRVGLPVVFLLHTDPDPGFEPGSPHVRPMDFIHPQPDEPVMVKDTRSSFSGTGLQKFLLSRGARRLAITGIQMEQCCETTARAAADLGYAVDFVIDATLTFPIVNHDRPGMELSVEAIEERTAYVLRRRFARIVTTGTLLDELAAHRVAR